jgi:hypothetical protein
LIAVIQDGTAGARVGELISETWRRELGVAGLVEQAAVKGLEGILSPPLQAKPFDAEKLLVALHETLTAADRASGSAS